MVIQAKLFDPSKIYPQIELMINDFIENLSEVQSKSYSKMKVFNQKLPKISFEFGTGNSLISQSRPLPSSLASEFSPPYIMSTFDSLKEVNFADILKDSDLR